MVTRWGLFLVREDVVIRLLVFLKALEFGQIIFFYTLDSVGSLDDQSCFLSAFLMLDTGTIQVQVMINDIRVKH
jgi:hypothetical protein